MLTRAGLAGVLAMLMLSVPARAEEFALSLPIACEPGKTCWVQQYVDRDPSPGVRDHACGSETYDGHDGTDIRIQDTADRGIAVLAAAPGTVKGLRDGMPDLLIRDNQDRALVKDRECGNGVVVDHEGGWQTQYCHMRVGSLRVKKGDKVERGDVLGEVGYSGLAQFPHVHLTVRKDGKTRDPFGGSDRCGEAEKTLWAADTLAALNYREGDIVGLGFASGPVRMEDLEEGRLAPDGPAADWPAMVAYAWAINLQAGDQLRVTLSGPSGPLAENTATLDRNKAQYMLFAGAKRPKDGWPRADYVAKIAVARNGAIAISKKVTARIE